MDTEFDAELAPLRQQLTAHPIYAVVNSPERLKIFMATHVHCVWDFMSILKSLQLACTCVEIPWVPKGDREIRRLVNEIVLGEESDVHPDGGHTSHLELYLESMLAAGACAAPFQQLLAAAAQGEAPESAARRLGAPAGVAEFLEATFSELRRGQLHRIAAVFTYGREDVIPEMFEGLTRAAAAKDQQHWGPFLYYLQRHIEIDGDEHGPMAKRLVSLAVDGDPVKRRDALDAAKTALRARILLWDATLPLLAALR
ncbi:MAG: hypothetical protein RL095_932 [Verrucomicrobiota bacterium]|jgi:hypothetical protein